MCSDFSDSWSLLSIITEHFDDEVLELIGQVLSTGLLPVSLEVVIEDEAIEVLVFLGLLEGENTLHDNEEDDCSGEQVDLNTIIVFVFLDFWSHVGHGTSIGLQVMDFTEGGKAEIRNLKVHEIVN